MIKRSGVFFSIPVGLAKSDVAAPVHKGLSVSSVSNRLLNQEMSGERGGSVVECRTPEREVGGSKPTTAVLCP